jgi:BirA family biotin operon repressor/biotin-[acetyl-CoA-carboxylase] ligase
VNRGEDLGRRLDGTRFTRALVFDSLDSTNRYARDEAERGAEEGLVVVADVQTAGRGRLGRTWEAPPGASLLVSVLLRPELPLEQWPLLTPAAALSAAAALQSLAGIDARLKWPNDLVVDDRKLAGLLAEAVQPPAALVLGMGLNVFWPSFPEELEGIATACNLCSDASVDRFELLVEWLTRFDRMLDDLHDPAGRRALRDATAARSATLGRRVRVALATRELCGVASGLTPEGHLEVTGDDGRVETVAAGDVIHLRATS